jgi:cytochrome c peroxidase
MKRLVVLALLVLPLPATAQTNNTLIGQGRALFNDPKLSASGQISCATMPRPTPSAATRCSRARWVA